jgi:hypothetical protein
VYTRKVLRGRIDDERLDMAVGCLVAKSQNSFMYFSLVKEELSKPELDIDELQIFFPETLIEALAKVCV